MLRRLTLAWAARPRLAAALAVAAMLAAAAPAWTADAPRSAQEQALEAVNALRAASGRKAVKLDAALTALADRLAYACAQAGTCDHNTGGTFRQRLRAAGLRGGYGAENIRRNERTLGGAFAWWTQSAMHRANMLIPQVRRIGFAQRFSQAGRGFFVLVLLD